MPAPRVERAKRLVTELREALDAAGLPEVMASIDAADVPSGARNGIAVVAAPKLTFSPVLTEAEFAVHVIAGPADNYLAAWERIDTIIAALDAGGINLADGEPGAYQSMHGEDIPAYTLTLNDMD